MVSSEVPTRTMAGASLLPRTFDVGEGRQIAAGDMLYIASAVVAAVDNNQRPHKGEDGGSFAIRDAAKKLADADGLPFTADLQGTTLAMSFAINNLKNLGLLDRDA
jgi:hypothetical protein